MAFTLIKIPFFAPYPWTRWTLNTGCAARDSIWICWLPGPAICHIRLESRNEIKLLQHYSPPPKKPTEGWQAGRWGHSSGRAFCVNRAERSRTAKLGEMHFLIFHGETWRKDNAKWAKNIRIMLVRWHLYQFKFSQIRGARKTLKRVTRIAGNKKKDLCVRPPLKSKKHHSPPTVRRWKSQDGTQCPSYKAYLG